MAGAITEDRSPESEIPSARNALTCGSGYTFGIAFEKCSTLKEPNRGVL